MKHDRPVGSGARQRIAVRQAEVIQGTPVRSLLVLSKLAQCAPEEPGLGIPADMIEQNEASELAELGARSTVGVGSLRRMAA